MVEERVVEVEVDKGGFVPLGCTSLQKKKKGGHTARKKCADFAVLPASLAPTRTTTEWPVPYQRATVTSERP
ncbi:MAG: hypothetical protein BRD48_00920 [Bacteroidetes bacterium QS_9_68_14]|nr:MAG: hypothetical protein BRD48_00920 [Bacteroidetes bacterium QS_9_68_14]